MTTEQAAQPATEPSELLAPQQAQAEIERLQGDPDFQKTYLSQFSEPGPHKEAVSRMSRLFALANPPEPPPGLARLPEQQPPQGEQQQQQQQQTLSEDEQTEAELSEAREAMENRFGSEWQDELPGVRDSVREVGGEALLDFLDSNYGSNPEVLGQLMEFQRENERYPLVAALAELAEANMTPQRARLMLDRHSADPEFFRRYTDASKPGHKEALALMRAFHIAASPPGFMTAQAESES